jgi:hypothetical protein
VIIVAPYPIDDRVDPVAPYPIDDRVDPVGAKHSANPSSLLPKTQAECFALTRGYRDMGKDRGSW